MQISSIARLFTGIAIYICFSVISFSTPILESPIQNKIFKSGDRISLEWAESGTEHFLWFEVWVNLNGLLLVNKWVRGDDLDELSLSDVVGSSAPASAGDYTWNIRGWEPVNGYGAWSAAGVFKVLPRVQVIVAPVLSRPENLKVFSGTWPLFYDYIGSNPSATWVQIEFYQEGGPLVREQWVEYTHTGIGGVFENEISSPALDTSLAPGVYSWRVREHSTEAGSGPWSDFRDFEISDVACATSSPAPEIRSIDLTHTASGSEGDGNRPWIDVDFHGFRSVDFFVSTNPGDVVVFNESIRFSDLSRGQGIMPILAPGDYNLWVRGNDRCNNSGAWTDPVEIFTVKSKPSEPDLEIQHHGFDRAGRAYFSWEAVPGFDWYQIQGLQDGTLVLDQWVNLSVQATAASVIQDEFDYDAKQRTGRLWSALQTEGAGDIKFWLRHYLAPGTYSDWALSDVSGPYQTQAPTVNIVGLGTNRPSFTWSDVGAMGSYEISITREDNLFFSEVLNLEEAVSSNQKSSEPKEYEVPLRWDSFFDFAPGSYKFWVRSASGSLRGDWSAVKGFVVPVP